MATYLARLAPGSRRTMRSALRGIVAALGGRGATLETFPWSQLRAPHVAAIRQLLVDGGRAPATSNRILSAVRGVLRECWRLGIVDADSYQRAVDVPPVRGSRLPAGRMLTDAELAALFRSCRRDPDAWRGGRDAAVLALLFGCGLRRAELVDLDLGDYDRRAGTVRVLGKGNRERLMPLPTGATGALEWWIRLRGAGDGPFILPLMGGVHRITPQAIYMLLRRRAIWSGVDPFSPHDLRRSYDSHLLDRGVDVNLVRQLMGHANVQTTLRYDRRPAAKLTDAVRRLHVPF